MMNKFIFLIILTYSINCKSTVLPITIKCNSENASNEAIKVEDSTEITIEDVIIDDDDNDETTDDSIEMTIEGFIINDDDDDETTEVNDSAATTIEGMSGKYSFSI